VSKVFWQAKIWGLLHDPVFKALHNNSGRGDNSCWKKLAVMQDWQNYDPEKNQGIAWRQIHLSDLIASASDRAAIGSLSSSVNYAPSQTPEQGLELRHLLSGEAFEFKLKPEQHQRITGKNRVDTLNAIESQLFDVIILDPTDQQQKPVYQVEDAKTVFWWLWRCLPIAACQALGDDESLLLMPAETRIPDASIWSHTSLTSAIAGALAGYDLEVEALKQWPRGEKPSRAHLAIFSFTPIQELIKASRKTRDFWAGSWLLHYLSAKVCWTLAQKYGPDSLIYPSLFQQPLIDAWLLESDPTLNQWIDPPTERQILTAGFPNIIVMALPEAKVKAAMQLAEQTLQREWLNVGKLVLNQLQQRRWMPGLTPDHFTWHNWLKGQWQTYWSSVAIGDPDSELTSSEIYKTGSEQSDNWRNAQNDACQLSQKQALFTETEAGFLQQAAALRRERYGKAPFNANVGSWWAGTFDQLRRSLSAVKNARPWQLPTAFGPRSTISGIGPTVHNDITGWVNEGKIQRLWSHHAGIFDGRERLNATETLKRGLHLVLPDLLPSSYEWNDQKIDASYPDLTAGVAGYLKVYPSHQAHYQRVCDQIAVTIQAQSYQLSGLPQGWGIPWVAEVTSVTSFNQPKYHSRHLNPGWLVEDIGNDVIRQLEQKIEQESDEAIIQLYQEELRQQRQTIQQSLQTTVDAAYPGNNPTDWYVLGAGDGDGMSEWLKGKKLKPYSSYVPQSLQERIEREDSDLAPSFRNFLSQQKRMGPSTHHALSRALLDFSNQLVPYLTEKRYAGRLVYSGGDDVLAYSNLWEWDQWLWDVRKCFRGEADAEFANDGNYWQWQDGVPPAGLSSRPLFTMGGSATISFGIVIASQGVPLAIAIENLWEAEAEAKAHFCSTLENELRKKDAVQVRVLYGNGNVLKATGKFAAFHQWQQLLTGLEDLQPALFEQAAQVWQQHPIPSELAIASWVKAFCDRRDALSTPEETELFGKALYQFLEKLWQTTEASELDQAVQAWLKLAAFVLRKREIKLGGKQ
jgi:CRISPR-associated protein Cmr2